MFTHYSHDGVTPICRPSAPSPGGLDVTGLVQHISCPGCWNATPDRARYTTKAGGQCLDRACTVPHYQAMRNEMQNSRGCCVDQAEAAAMNCGCRGARVPRRWS